MKPIQLILTICFAVVALSIAAWFGRPQVASIQKRLPPQSTDGNDIPVKTNGPHPKAVAKETTHNFGAVELGATGEHVFTITNEGTVPMTVKSGKTSCGQCTFQKPINRDDVQPGETVDIVVTYNIKSPSPNFRQWAEVFTNDPDNKRFEFAIEGQVTRSINLSPDENWMVGDLFTSEPTVIRGTLSSKMIEGLTIEKIETSKEGIDVKWEAVPPDNELAKDYKSLLNVIVSIPPGQPIGPFREKVTLHIPVKGGTKFEFQLLGTQPGPIDVKGLGWNQQSNTLVLGEVPSKIGKKAKLMFYVREFDDEMTIEVARQRYNSIKITPQKGRAIGKARMYEVEFELLPNQPVGSRRGDDCEELELKFNHPKAKGMKILVSYQTI